MLQELIDTEKTSKSVLSCEFPDPDESFSSEEVQTTPEYAATELQNVHQADPFWE